MTTPIVLDAESIQDFIRHVLDHHIAPTSLVICSSKHAFFESLHAESGRRSNARHIWTTPTIRLLSSSSSVKLAFCPDITHLRAYLSTYSISISRREPEPETALRHRDATPILAILNPIELHRPTSAFSAQGLNRTFAVAIEAAHSTGSKLVIAECLPMPEPILDAEDQAGVEEIQRTCNPWDEELSILNVTTKRLGDLSVGRTVKARAVAER